MGSDFVGNSVIIGYLVYAISALKKYYKDSNFKRIAESLQNSLERSKNQSLILSTLAAESSMNTRWTGSCLYSIIIKPVRLAKRVLRFCLRKTENMVQNSIVLSGMDNILSNIFNYSIRSYGAFFAALFAAEGLLWMIFQVNELKYVLLRLVLLAAAFIMLFVDVPVAAFFKGSFLFRFVEKGFENKFVAYSCDKQSHNQQSNQVNYIQLSK